MARDQGSDDVRSSARKRRKVDYREMEENDSGIGSSSSDPLSPEQPIASSSSDDPMPEGTIIMAVLLGVVIPRPPSHPSDIIGKFNNIRKLMHFSGYLDRLKHDTRFCDPALYDTMVQFPDDRFLQKYASWTSEYQAVSDDARATLIQDWDASLDWLTHHTTVETPEILLKEVNAALGSLLVSSHARAQLRNIQRACLENHVMAGVEEDVSDRQASEAVTRSSQKKKKKKKSAWDADYEPLSSIVEEEEEPEQADRQRDGNGPRLLLQLSTPHASKPRPSNGLDLLCSAVDSSSGSLLDTALSPPLPPVSSRKSHFSPWPQQPNLTLASSLRLLPSSARLTQHGQHTPSGVHDLMPAIRPPGFVLSQPSLLPLPFSPGASRESHPRQTPQSCMSSPLLYYPSYAPWMQYPSPGINYGMPVMRHAGSSSPYSSFPYSPFSPVLSREGNPLPRSQLLNPPSVSSFGFQPPNLRGTNELAQRGQGWVRPVRPPASSLSEAALPASAFRPPAPGAPKGRSS